MRLRSPQIEARLKDIAESTTAGIWRIKRAKIVLGFWKERTVDQLVLDVRVPPESVTRCINEFEKRGLAYFDEPDRRPTNRELRVERVLSFLENPPDHKSNRWHEWTVHYIGRDFTAWEIFELRAFIASHPSANRSQLADRLCVMFDLYQTDGKIKKSTASHILKRMAMDNIIRLPDPLPRKPRKPRQNPSNQVKPKELVLSKEEIPKLRFIPVDTRSQNALWREMIECFHYINGYRIFGSQIRYLVYGDIRSTTLNTSLSPVLEHVDESACRRIAHQTRRHPVEGADGQHLLAALAFGACAWKLESRDDYIGWTDSQRERNLNLVVNNVRFLILPWIKSPNLASRILGGIARQVPADWEKRYNYRPVLLETFVQLDRHRGICYLAANWTQTGTTSGYSHSSKKKKQVPEKAIFLYPLHRKFRQILCN